MQSPLNGTEGAPSGPSAWGMSGLPELGARGQRPTWALSVTPVSLPSGSQACAACCPRSDGLFHVFWSFSNRGRRRVSLLLVPPSELKADVQILPCLSVHGVPPVARGRLCRTSHLLPDVCVSPRFCPLMTNWTRLPVHTLWKMIFSEQTSGGGCGSAWLWLWCPAWSEIH